MGLWGKIKREVSRVNHKAGLDMNSTQWKYMSTGAAVGTIVGGVAGTVVSGFNPAGTVLGGVAGGTAGAVAGKTAADYKIETNEIADRNAALQEKAIAMSSRVEAELTDNNQGEEGLEADGELKRKRLAASYSLSATRNSYAKAKGVGSGRTTLG